MDDHVTAAEIRHWQANPLNNNFLPGGVTYYPRVALPGWHLSRSGRMLAARRAVIRRKVK